MKSNTNPSTLACQSMAPGSAPANIAEDSDDWLQSLFAKRRHGRRMSPDLPPPYATGDGMVMVDRRSHRDRRRALDQTTIVAGNQG